MKKLIRVIVAVLTFSVGVSLSQKPYYAVVLVLPVAVFFLFYPLLLGIVIHQLVVREVISSQVIGKGVIAGMIWLVPSLVVLFISSAYVASHIPEVATRSPLALLVIGATSTGYGLVGLAIFRWVRNPNNEELGLWVRDSWRNY